MTSNKAITDVMTSKGTRGICPMDMLQDGLSEHMDVSTVWCSPWEAPALIDLTVLHFHR